MLEIILGIIIFTGFVIALVVINMLINNGVEPENIMLDDFGG